MKLNEKIKNARKAAGLTQQQVADAIDTSKQYYASYEQGTRQPRLDNLKRIAEACGVELDYFGDDVNHLQKGTGVNTADKRNYFKIYMRNYRKKVVKKCLTYILYRV